jgi:tetratricopeptide (TPR) repeat protein
VIALQNLANVELLSGRFPEAREVARVGVELQPDSLSLAYMARAAAALGEVSRAQEWFHSAKGSSEQRLMSGPGLWEAEFAFQLGAVDRAYSHTFANREAMARRGNLRLVALCETLLGRLALPDEPDEARRFLASARDFGSRSGEVQVQLRCYHLAAEIARTERAFEQARGEAEAGIHLADTCGFGHSAIELRLALARTLLDAGDPRAALGRAREALDRSTHPECSYAWGEADALHLCGVAHARLGEVDLARQCLDAAVAKREALSHPGLPDTLAEFDHARGE